MGLLLSVVASRTSDSSQKAGQRASDDRGLSYLLRDYLLPALFNLLSKFVQNSRTFEHVVTADLIGRARKCSAGTSQPMP